MGGVSWGWKQARVGIQAQPKCSQFTQPFSAKVGMGGAREEIDDSDRGGERRREQRGRQEREEKWVD